MSDITQFLITYGYFLAVPVMIIEGPVATMIMATLASLGHFNIFVVFALALFADLFSDYFWYKIGHTGGKAVAGRLANRFGNRGLVDFLVGHFDSRGPLMIFLAKILPGMVPPVFIAAGMVSYPLKRLYAYASVGGIIWSAMLAAVGYYFGKHVHNVDRLLSRTGLVLLILIFLIIAYQYFFGKFVAQRVTKQIEKEG